MGLTMGVLAGLGAEVRAGEEVWWEGENPASTNFPRAGGPFNAEGFGAKREVLSGGNWLTNFGPRGKNEEEAFAIYSITVPRDGEYHFWARKFWKHGSFWWRFDEGPWRTCDREVALADAVTIRTNLEVNWVYLGDVKLTGGAHTFELRLLAKEGEDKVACFDCFLLTPGLFMPNGKLRPGERSNLAEEGFFAYEPAVDPFTDEALLDLRSLNEKSAGESGFIKHEGNGFALGSGQRVRFWAVNVSSNNAGQSHQSVDYMARRLAKLGVNMVRFHSPMFDSPRPSKIDAKKLDDLQYLVAAMRREGIYTSISVYFPLWVEMRNRPDFAGYDAGGNKHPFALLYFDSKMQALYRSWLKDILTTNNPYTGVPLAKEPAVAMVELVNEDSFFFWTFLKQNIPAPYWIELETQFAQWLIQRYGSLDKAYANWGGAKVREDQPDRPAILEAWHMTREGVKSGGAEKARRMSDQVRFLAETQRGFYADTARYVHQDLGSPTLITCSNWRVSDATMLDAIERWTYMAGDVIDAHGYFQGKHEGEGAAWSVRVGQSYQDLPAVLHPERLPIQFNQVDGYPQIISEVGWPSPNRYRADAAFLCSAYGAVQGIDGIYFFALENNFVRTNGISKFAVATPSLAATFPAAALQYRRGDIAEAKPEVYQALNPEDLFSLKGSAALDPDVLDDTRRTEASGEAASETDKLKLGLQAYLGPVIRHFGESTNQPVQPELAKHIDPEAKTIRTADGQVMWDYGRGVATVNTPRSQGAAGFLSKAGRIVLQDIVIECGNEFASIQVISLDGRPLAQSRTILIQAMTEDRPYGFKTEGNKITDLGSGPLNVRTIQAAIEFKFAAGGPARILDENGYATGKWVAFEGNRLTLPAGAIYCILERQP